MLWNYLKRFFRSAILNNSKASFKYRFRNFPKKLGKIRQIMLACHLTYYITIQFWDKGRSVIKFVAWLFFLFSALSLGKRKLFSALALCLSVCPSVTASSLQGVDGLVESLWAKDLNYGEKYFENRSWSWPGGFEEFDLIYFPWIFVNVL
jgi:hypothetical protein